MTLELSKHGKKLIKLYEHMARKGYNKTDGNRVENAFDNFEIRKFRKIIKKKINNIEINSLLDYGGGASNWNKPNFEPTTGESAKQFFKIDKVTVFEPARNLNNKVKSDCVVCIDVLEHIFLADVANVVDELFSLTNKILIINVACYKATALLPNGENAHITVRSPDWWRGLIDSIATKHENVEVVLICSNTYNAGVIYESFKTKDWHSSKTYTIGFKYRTFGTVDH
jgi:hypothetical protein